MRGNIAWFGIGLALVLAFPTAAAADPFDAFTGTIDVGSPQNGGINTTGRGRQRLRDFSLGIDFLVTAPAIKVTELGMWDDRVLDPTSGAFEQVIGSPHVLSIWNIDTGELLAEIDVEPGTGDLRGDYRYFELDEPVWIPEGTRFTVALYLDETNVDTTGNGGNELMMLEPYPIFDAGHGLDNIGCDLGGRYGPGPGFPGTPDNGPVNRYHATSLTWSPVPEPGTLALVCGSLAAVGAARRRRRARMRESPVHADAAGDRRAP